MKSNSVGNTAFQKFLNENKSIKYMLPILIVLIIVFLIMMFSGSFKAGKNSIPSSQYSEGSIPSDNDIDDTLPLVEVLPQTTRSNNQGNSEVKKDPFEAIMKLVGVVYSSEKPTAIIEWGDYSYIVKLNDKVGDSDWSVANIEKDSITLVSGDDSIVLDLTDGTNTNANNVK